MHKRLSVWLAVLFTVAAISFLTAAMDVGGWRPFGDAQWQNGLLRQHVMFACNWAWLLGMIAAPFFLRWRALWLLLTLPVIGYWPYIVWQAWDACAKTPNCYW